MEEEDNVTIDETYISKESIAYYPSLNIPGETPEGEGGHPSDVVHVDYIKGLHGYTNRLYLKKTNVNTIKTEQYRISINGYTGRVQMGMISPQEMTKDILESNSYGSFKIEFPNGFNALKISHQIQEALDNSPKVNIDWLHEDKIMEISLVRGLLTVLRENDMEIFEDNFNEYHVLMDWMLNSPLIEEVDNTVTHFQSFLKEDQDRDTSNDNILELVEEVDTTIRLILDDYDDKDDIMNFFDFINSRLVDKDDRYIVDGEEVTFLGAIYRNIKKKELSATSEIMYLITLYTHMKYSMGMEELMITSIYPKDNPSNKETTIGDGELFLYWKDINGKHNLIGYEDDQDDGRSLSIIKVDDPEEIQEMFGNMGIITIKGINDSVAGQLLNTEFSKPSEVINLLMVDLDDNEYLDHNPFDPSEELSESILNEAKNETKVQSVRRKIMTRINALYRHLDKTGLNGKAVKDHWGSLTDDQFVREMRKFLKNDEANFTLEVLPGKNEPSLKEIGQALKALNVPENEFVYFRHQVGTEKNPIRTMYEIPVGYLHVRRLQQLLTRKNSYSLDIDTRNTKTGYNWLHIMVTLYDKYLNCWDILKA